MGTGGVRIEDSELGLVVNCSERSLDSVATGLVDLDREKSG